MVLLLHSICTLVVGNKYATMDIEGFENCQTYKLERQN